MQTKALWTALLLGILAPFHTGRDDPRGSQLVSILVLIGGPGRATVVNRALGPIGIGQCEPGLELLQGQEWVGLGERTSGCERELGLLMPGDSGTLRFRCPAHPGTYRLSIPVVLERKDLEPLTSMEHSPAFTVTRAAAESAPCTTGQAL